MDKEKTAFSIGTGLWQFQVMPFGFCNAPPTFERLKELMLRGLPWTTCLAYLDDLSGVLGRLAWCTWTTCLVYLDDLPDVLGRLAWCTWTTCLVYLDDLPGVLGRLAWCTWTTCLVYLDDLPGVLGRLAWCTWTTCLMYLDDLPGVLGRLAWCTWTTCLVYLDDTLVHDRSFADNVHCLREVLRRFRCAGFILSLTKRNLFRLEVANLGHANGVAIHPIKTTAINEWSVPNTKKDVRRFISLFTY